MFIRFIMQTKCSVNFVQGSGLALAILLEPMTSVTVLYVHKNELDA